MGSARIELAKVTLPSFGVAKVSPQIPAAVYISRHERVLSRMRDSGLDTLAIYGDREHSANLAYLTGFDPRFEESLMLVSSDGRRKLLVGNECLGFLPDTVSLGIEIELFQEFSLMGQSRTESRPLRQILKEFGINPRQRVGTVGWKYFASELLGRVESAIELPAYLVDTLRELIGDWARLVNATGLFMDVEEGLRVTNEAVQIAQFEYSSCLASQGILRLLQHLHPGITEQTLEKYLDSQGLPLSCHRMISFGSKARRGLASPSANRARLGDAFTTAFGIQGALTCRAGVIAHHVQDLAPALRNFYEPFVSNYFQVVAAWFESLRVGAKAQRVVRAVDSIRNKRLFRLALNPGHYLHLDEWVHSPFTSDSTVVLRSGMVLQMDIIPISLGPFCCANAEDGIALADAKLRAQLSREFPSLWQRFQTRREFMVQSLGINLHESVLPLGNIPGWFPPYGLNLEIALRKV